MRVAVLGTGIMGAGMTRNLVAAGHEVRAWNRTRAKAEDLGAEVADSPAAAVAGAAVVVTMLSDAETVGAVLDQAAEGLERGAAWAQTSTVGEAGARRLGGRAAELGLAYVDAPVLGTRQPAEKGQLVVLAAGDPAGREACAPVFEAIGAKTIDLGGDPGAASRFKVVLNSWVLALTEATGETLALAAALGVDGRRVLETFAGGPLDSGYLQTKGEAILSGSYTEPAFPLALAGKDARLALEAAEEAGIDLPALRGTAEAFRRAVEDGHGEEDMAATYASLVAPRRGAAPRH